MAKNKKKSEEFLPSGKVNESHFKPQEETSGPPERPAAIDPAHLKPQVETKVKDAKRPEPVDEAHTRPQE